MHYFVEESSQMQPLLFLFEVNCTEMQIAVILIM